MHAWESFIPETLNQQFCRLLLSVQKKTSRLAVLGELGHYPLLVTSFVQTLNYKWAFNLQDCNSLVCDAVMDSLKWKVTLTLDTTVGYLGSEKWKSCLVSHHFIDFVKNNMLIVL